MTTTPDPASITLNIIGEIKAGHAYLVEINAEPLPPCRCGAFSIQYEGACTCARGREIHRRERMAAERRAADLVALPELLALDFDAELARLRAIETAAREVLSTGQARYDVEPNHDESECPVGDPDCDAPDDGEWHCHDACEAPEWVGDLVPAAAMVALRAAVEGEATS